MVQDYKYNHLYSFQLAYSVAFNLLQSVYTPLLRAIIASF